MKSKKKTRVFGLILIILLLVTSGFFIYNIVLLHGIETFYRIMLILFIIFFDFLIVKGLFYSAIIRTKKGKLIFLTITTLILSIIYGIIGVVIFLVYNKLDNFNKDKVTYTSNLITLSEGPKKVSQLKKKKIGIIKDSNDVEGYVLPKQMIKEEDLEDNNEIIQYNDSLDMVEDLYDEEIDAAFVSGNYKITFNNIDGYENIANETQVILEKSKTMKKQEDTTSSKKQLTEPFTMLLLGVDSEKDGLNANQSFNGDTIMMITFNPKTLNATMFSIPRDTYVPISCNGNRENKINSAAYGGTECMIKTVENLTHIDIDYYAKVNFKGVVELVDAVGGITVDVPIKFCEQNSDRLWGSKQICLNKGVQKLNGEQALALSRHRKTLALGDFARGQNQQLVVEALINQMKNVKNAKDFYAILDAVSNNIDTNLTTKQLLSFYNIGKRMMFNDSNNVLNIQKTFLRGYDQYIGGMYTFQYYNGSLSDIIDVMKINLGLKKAKKVKTFSFSINEEYERYIAGDGEYNESKRTDLQVSSSSNSSRRSSSSSSSNNTSSNKNTTTNNNSTKTVDTNTSTSNDDDDKTDISDDEPTITPPSDVNDIGDETTPSNPTTNNSPNT